MIYLTAIELKPGGIQHPTSQQSRYLLFGNTSYPVIVGVRGGTVSCGTVLQAGRPPVRFPMVLLEFFNDIVFPAAL
jgi:hypothetical protein